MNPINNADNITNDKKWKVLNEKDRYNIELLLKEGYKIKNKEVILKNTQTQK